MRMLRVIAIATLVAGFTSAVGAAHQEGHWIKLFDGESTFGWTNLGDTQWAVEGGVLKAADGSGGMLATTSQFGDFELTAKVRVKAGCSSGIVVRSPLSGHPTENGAGVIWLSEEKGSDSPWREIKVTAQGDKVSATLDGKAVEGLAAKNPVGYIGVLYHHNGGATVEISEMQLRPIALHTIFDGKTLDEWSIIPDRKSEFAVVDGAINITNGNGQIETKGVYKNFLAQMEIISNGEHLNSGVFYRGPVGVFWLGYESQVRNQWTGDDRSKPVDFGTGGIYGNQATRKVVSSDGEWFQKTIVANGNHSAVWINGYLVSDFLDTRPVNKNGNGKEGYVPGPGTIHLQGHDPTTDLSFKNIAIEIYPD